MRISIHFSGQVAMNRIKNISEFQMFIFDVLIFLNKHIGNFEKLIKLIEFSLKTIKD